MSTHSQGTRCTVAEVKMEEAGRGVLSHKNTIQEAAQSMKPTKCFCSDQVARCPVRTPLCQVINAAYFETECHGRPQETQFHQQLREEHNSG